MWLISVSCSSNMGGGAFLQIDGILVQAEISDKRLQCCQRRQRRSFGAQHAWAQQRAGKAGSTRDSFFGFVQSAFRADQQRNVTHGSRLGQ